MKKFGIILGTFLIVVAIISYFDVIDRVMFLVDPFSLVNGSHYEEVEDGTMNISVDFSLSDIDKEKPVLYENDNNGKIYIDKIEKDDDRVKIYIAAIGVMSFDIARFLKLDNSSLTFASGDEILDISSGGSGVDNLENGYLYSYDFVDAKNLFDGNDSVTINIQNIEIHSHKRKFISDL